jgi:hypothetical protein
MIARNNPVECAPRQKIHQLREQRLAGVHGLAPRRIVGQSLHGIKSAPATNYQNPLRDRDFREILAQRTGQQCERLTQNGHATKICVSSTA